MENNLDYCMKLAKRIYDLDAEVYRLVGSSLGRTFTGDEETSIRNLATLLHVRPHGHLLRSEIALIGNMARTIRSKEDRSRMLDKYEAILAEIADIPASFGSVDILDETLASLNTSNLHQKFSEDDHLIICIGRTHGSAGTDIGFALADALKINYYDVEIFNQVLERLDAEKDSVWDRESCAANPKKSHKPCTGFRRHFRDFSRYHGLPKKDAVFFNQSDLIVDMAKKEDFIVMGRCADVILTNNRIPHISIFITAPFEQRLRRMMEMHNLDLKHAVRLLKKLDKQHEHYYQFYTGRKWGAAVNYDLCINSACYGIEESVELIERMIDRRPEKKLNFFDYLAFLSTLSTELSTFFLIFYDFFLCFIIIQRRRTGTSPAHRRKLFFSGFLLRQPLIQPFSMYIANDKQNGAEQPIHIHANPDAKYAEPQRSRKEVAAENTKDPHGKYADHHGVFRVPGGAQRIRQCEA